MVVSDQEIAEGLEAVFRETNPNSFTSLNEVILRLQSKLGGLDLSHKLDFIRAHITLLFSPPPTTQPPLPRPNPNPINPNPNPNPNHPLPSHPHPNHPHAHPQSRPHAHPQQQQQQQQHVFQQHAPPSHSHSHPHSHFPRGPTEISFAQPGGGTAVVADSVSPKESTQTRPKRRGGPGGLNKLCGVSPQLEAIVGQPALPRTEIVKQLWAYIRKNNLQDPSNKRKIICNDELRLVFEVDCTDMFQMNKLLAKHIVPLDPSKDSGQQSKKLKVEEPQAEAEAQAQAPIPEPVPIVISEALAKFFGTGEKEMLQSEVYKRIEEYIKVEGLEDPLNSMVVCDTKLQELLGCESIPTPGVREALARNHLFQRA